MSRAFQVLRVSFSPVTHSVHALSPGPLLLCLVLTKVCVSSSFSLVIVFS